MVARRADYAGKVQQAQAQLAIRRKIDHIRHSRSGHRQCRATGSSHAPVPQKPVRDCTAHSKTIWATYDAGTLAVTAKHFGSYFMTLQTAQSKAIRDARSNTFHGYHSIAHTGLTHTADGALDVIAVGLNRHAHSSFIVADTSARLWRPPPGQAFLHALYRDITFAAVCPQHTLLLISLLHLGIAVTQVLSIYVTRYAWMKSAFSLAAATTKALVLLLPISRIIYIVVL